MSDFITNGELRIEAERLCDENEQLKADNAKLRELAKEMWSVMWACAEERCTHRENGCYRVSGNGTAPKGHGECWFKQRMRELVAEP